MPVRGEGVVVGPPLSKVGENVAFAAPYTPSEAVCDAATSASSFGTLLLWTVGRCLYGVLVGSVVYGIGDVLGDSSTARDVVARLALEQAFIAVAFTMLRMVAAAFAISLTL